VWHTFFHSTVAPRLQAGPSSCELRLRLNGGGLAAPVEIGAQHYRSK
jgi:hypothetical protein